MSSTLRITLATTLCFTSTMAVLTLLRMQPSSSPIELSGAEVRPTLSLADPRMG